MTYIPVVAPNSHLRHWWCEILQIINIVDNYYRKQFQNIKCHLTRTDESLIYHPTCTTSRQHGHLIICSMAVGLDSGLDRVRCPSSDCRPLSSLLHRRLNGFTQYSLDSNLLFASRRPTVFSSI